MTSTPSQLVECPNCQRTLPYTHLNPHLDRCLVSEPAAHDGADRNGSSGTGKAEDDSHPPTQTATLSRSFFSPASASASTPLRAKSNGAGARPSPQAEPFHAQLHAHPTKRQRLESDAGSPRPASRSTPANGADLSSGAAQRTFTSPAPQALPHPQHPQSSARSRIDAAKPFAERMRPQSLDDYVGQDQVINGPLKMLLRQGRIPSMILWGPPGTGKTTLARLLAKSTHSTSDSTGPSRNSAAAHRPPPHRFVEISATTAGTADVKKIMDEALNRLQLTGQPTLLFIDEIQRFSRAQQDVFLPSVEKGQIVLVAATTENPSFRLQGALLSRMRVFVLTKLSVDECCTVLNKAIERVRQERRMDHLGEEAGGDDAADPLAHIDADLVRWIANVADGDARTALGALELAFSTTDPGLSSADNVDRLKKALSRTALQYDRTGDGHYDTISALHKSIRGSDANAALYWLARMVCSGDDPLFIARRLIVAASEDIDSLEALQMATATYQACQVVGLPECGENLAQCVVFLAERPKSTRSYRAWKKVKACVEGDYNHPVPLHIRNAPTKLMKDIGYGREYRYEPRFAHPVYQEFLPDEIKTRRFLSPPPRSEEDVGEADEASGDADAPSSSEEARRSASEPASADGPVAAPTKFSSTMPKAAGIGPGSCQRQFEIGARAVDLDLLDEWERERNGGKPWSGRRELERMLARLQNDVDAAAVVKKDEAGGA
ncbi:uncharacterized protein PFL1_05787 [Pseudozyma flocculosa PF-1]|uniref:Related to MGS1 - Maintenance of Genome Stability 1 n=2 Tax=Pseudozyma flocculosa TaxID=84751 RepID=A0A5C3FBV1_9BASI|nr:uncharacterized protein PFL1_05787 [Pseudozyma flocculosa PF-1]EPQ26809.1 hypothetical protein PFL1_05787 [Pseudozyma flocculosa PF-1]SPO40859.1 related to MGS1 - Maintenance of Genome Stability 1 [Pseudozyma flocculosa]